MYIIQKVATGEFVKNTYPWYSYTTDVNKAKVYKSEHGAKRSICGYCHKGELEKKWQQRKKNWKLIPLSIQINIGDQCCVPA